MTEHNSPFITRFEAKVMFVVLMTAAIALALLFQAGQQRQDAIFARQVINQDKIVKNQQDILVANNAICLYRNKLVMAHNQLVSELELGVGQLNLPPAQQDIRLARYKSAEVMLQNCPPLPPLSPK